MINKHILLACLILFIVLPVAAMISFARLGMPLFAALLVGLLFGVVLCCIATQVLTIVFRRKGVRPCA